MENRIDDALDRLARDGLIGGDVPPPMVVKRDLSKKEKIDYTEFLQYFRGLASERDLQLRRELVDQAVATKGAAKPPLRRPGRIPKNSERKPWPSGNDSKLIAIAMTIPGKIGKFATRMPNSSGEMRN